MRNIHTYALKFIDTLLEGILSGYTQKICKSVKFESSEGKRRENLLFILFNHIFKGKLTALND